MSPKPFRSVSPAKPLYVQPEALKGRGSVWAIAHRYQDEAREQYDDGWGTLDQSAREEKLAPATQIIEEQAKKILSSNQSPDISFVLWERQVALYQ